MKNLLSIRARKQWLDPAFRQKIAAAFRLRRSKGIKPIDSRLEAEAAERDVVTRLCMRGLIAYQYPRNFRTVDVLAFMNDSRDGQR